jgi:hypothetical protein
MKSVGAAVIGFCAALAICAGVASATVGGGATIATAPVVPAGAQRTGNTATNPDTCGNYYEFWKLHLTQGDIVKITWGSPAAVDKLALFPAGTLDSDNTSGCYYAPGWVGWTSSPVLMDTNAAVGTQHLAQTVATQDGDYPLLLLDTTGAGNAGPYSFTLAVQHAASVSFTHQSTVPGIGTFRAAVLAPDGSSINDSTLKLTLNGYWGNRKHKLGTASPVNGIATFNYSLPWSVWGKKIRLAFSGGGSSYQAVTSDNEVVKVLVPVPLDPVLAPAAELKAVSNALGQPIYWAGPRRGSRYELRRTTNGSAYVRYLPHGVHPGDPRAKFLTIATYPLSHAYRSLKKYAHGKTVAGPNGSIYFVYPADPRSVYVAFPNVNYEIEVYDPSAKVARKIVTSGLVRPVR